MRTVCIAAVVLFLSTLSISGDIGEDDSTPESSTTRQGADAKPPSVGGGGGGGGGGGAFAAGEGVAEEFAGAGAAGLRRPYSFGYSVNDPATGNVHSRQESADINGVVTGHYQLIEPDGTLRIVDYVADANGFRPTIRRIPNYAPPPPQPPRLAQSWPDAVNY